jgi:hypothetical protein
LFLGAEKHAMDFNFIFSISQGGKIPSREVGEACEKFFLRSRLVEDNVLQLRRWRVLVMCVRGVVQAGMLSLLAGLGIAIAQMPQPAPMPTPTPMPAPGQMPQPGQPSMNRGDAGQQPAPPDNNGQQSNGQQNAGRNNGDQRNHYQNAGFMGG